MTLEDVRHVSTPAAPPPAGHYSQAVVHGGVVWIAGQTPRDPEGARLEGEPFVDQARQTLRNVEAIAAAAGSSLAHALQVTVYLADPADRFAFDDVWCEFVAEPFPARAIVGAILPGFALEVVTVCRVVDALT